MPTPSTPAAVNSAYAHLVGILEPSASHAAAICRLAVQSANLQPGDDALNLGIGYSELLALAKPSIGSGICVGVGIARSAGRQSREAVDRVWLRSGGGMVAIGRSGCDAARGRSGRRGRGEEQCCLLLRTGGWVGEGVVDLRVTSSGAGGVSDHVIAERVVA